MFRLCSREFSHSSSPSSILPSLRPFRSDTCLSDRMKVKLVRGARVGETEGQASRHFLLKNDPYSSILLFLHIQGQFSSGFNTIMFTKCCLVLVKCSPLKRSIFARQNRRPSKRYEMLYEYHTSPRVGISDTLAAR